MTVLDHIAVIAPDLETGNAWVREVLGVSPLPGGKHPLMGTHNCLLRIGEDVFLEVIAVDPAAPAPAVSRWFGLDDQASVQRNWQSGRRLGAYIARCHDVAATIGSQGGIFGQSTQLTRGDLVWTFGVRCDGSLPLGGALPHVMDWGSRGPLAPALQDFGLRLRELIVEAPDPGAVHAGLDAIGMARKPTIRKAEAVRLSAAIETPHGVRMLT
jgi:Glyoxalase-like domain